MSVEIVTEQRKYWQFQQHSSHPLPEYIWKFVNEYKDPYDAYFCCEVARLALMRTSRVVRAWSVSLAVSFCTYAARLIESIGVKGTYSVAIPGKGALIHKLLAMVAPYVFYKYLKRRERVTSEEISMIVRKAIDNLKMIEPIKMDKSEISEVIARTQRIIQNFVTGIEMITQQLKLDLSKCDAFVEQQLIDFDLHIIGTPDFVIECHDDRRRAIVIEWKTHGKTTPYPWEKTQIYVYALLEAARLGYGKRVGIPSSPTRIDFDELIRAIACDNPQEVAVYSVIIREKGLYSDHPALHICVKKPHTVDSLRELLYKIVIAAAHLTLLITDYVSLSNYDENEIKSRCEIEIRVNGKVYRGSALRWTPKILTSRGKPATRQGYPCDVCARCFKHIYDACPLFFGKGPEKGVLDKFIWNYRFRIYSIHERGLLPLKALHDIGRDKFVDAVVYGRSLKYNSSLLTYGFALDIGLSSKRAPVLRCVSKIHSSHGDFRIDVYDEAYVPFIPFEAGDIRERRLAIELVRRIRDYELEGYREGEDIIPRIWTPRQGKPVLVVLNDHASTPTLSISIFGRVGEVQIDDYFRIRLRVEPISSALRLPFVIAAIYHMFKPEMFRNVLVMEVNSDLTHIELHTLYELQRILKEEYEKLKNEILLENEDIEKLKNIVRQSHKDVFRLIAGSFLVKRRSGRSSEVSR